MRRKSPEQLADRRGAAQELQREQGRSLISATNRGWSEGRAAGTRPGSPRRARTARANAQRESCVLSSRRASTVISKSSGQRAQPPPCALRGQRGQPHHQSQACAELEPGRGAMNAAHPDDSTATRACSDSSDASDASDAPNERDGRGTSARAKSQHKPNKQQRAQATREHGRERTRNDPGMPYSESGAKSGGDALDAQPQGLRDPREPVWRGVGERREQRRDRDGQPETGDTAAGARPREALGMFGDFPAIPGENAARWPRPGH